MRTDLPRPRAMATIDVRPGSSTPTVLSSAGRHQDQNLVDRIRRRPRVRPRPREMRDNSLKQFFTESLILAQDERWRRA